MSMSRSFSLSPVLCIGLLLSGLLLSWTLAARRARHEIRRLRGVEAVRSELASLARTDQTRKALLRQRFSGPVRPLSELVGEELGPRVEVVPGDPTLLPPNTRAHEARLDVSGLRWDQLRDLLTRLENGTPPWRVISLDIRAEGIHLNGSLMVRTLEWRE